MSTIAEPATPRRPFSDLLPATMLVAVIGTSLIILCHLVVVLWLSFSDGTPGTGLTYTSANYTEVFSDAPHLYGADRHLRVCVRVARGRARHRHPDRLDRRAHRLPRQDAAVHADGGRASDPGLRGRHGMAVPAASAHRAAQSTVPDRLRHALAVLDHHHPRHGLGAGAQPCAARLHHDRGGLPLHGSIDGGSGRGARRRAAARAARASPCGSPGPASWRRRSMCS